MQAFTSHSMKDFESYEYKEVKDTNGSKDIPLSRWKSLEFIYKGTGAYVVPSDSYLNIRYKIMTDTGSELESTPVRIGYVGPTNNGFHCIDVAKYYIGTDKLDDIRDVGLMTLCNSLIDYTDDFEQGQGLLEGFIPDKFDSSVSDVSKIYVRNLTQPSLAVYPLTVAAGVFQVNAGAATSYANNDLISLFYKYKGKNYDLIPYVSRTGATQAIEVTLICDGALGAAIDYTGITSADNVEFYNISHMVKIYAGTSTYITADATPNMTTGGATPTSSDVYAKVGIKNPGFEKRRELCLTNSYETSRTYNLCLPLKRIIKFWEANPILIKGNNHTLNLEMNDIKRYLIRDSAAGACSVKLLNVSWMLPVVKPKIYIDKAYNDFLNSGQILPLSWTQSKFYQSDVRSSSQYQDSWQISALKHRATRVIIFFQNALRKTDQTYNEMIFDHFGVSNLQLTLNDTYNYPDSPLRIDFGYSTPQSSTESPSNEDYMRAYRMYLNSCSKIYSQECLPCVSYDDFKTIYPMFVFDLKPVEDDVFGGKNTVKIDVDYTLNESLLSGINFKICAVIDFERSVKFNPIDGNLTIIT